MKSREPNGDAAEGLSADAPSADGLAAITQAIEAEFLKLPPTICVIGLSGVGKSSTINKMFGTRRHVSATTRGTSRFSRTEVPVEQVLSERMDGARIKCAVRVIDAPGLGEDVALDEAYLKRYREHLPKADIALWVLAARNRALALDQQYLAKLRGRLPNLVIGINQVDLVDPLGWDERLNLPSAAQRENIAAIVEDRGEKLGRFLGTRPPVIAYSAHRIYNLQALFLACITAAPPRRRWMFDLLKSFSTQDWLAQAKGLTQEQKAALAERYIASDRKVRARDVPAG